VAMIEAGTAVTVAGAAHALGLDAAGADFLKRILAKTGDDLGEVLSHFTTRRLKNWARVTEQAERLAAVAGGEVHEIPLRTLAPLIDAASNAELEALRMLDPPGRWGMPPLLITATNPFRVTSAGRHLLALCRAPAPSMLP
jgi:hypothetical protein